MNAQKYTQKSLEAVQNAQSIATEYGNQQIEQPHLLLALLLDEGGLIPQLLGNMGLTVPSFTAAAKAEVEKLPRVSGSGRDPDKVYISQATDKVLSAAAREAKAMKDDFISVEHLFLGLLDEQDQTTSELFRAFNLKKDAFLQQLGNQAVFLRSQCVQQVGGLQRVVLVLHSQLLGCLQSLKGLLGILIGIHKVKPPFIPEGLF